ncbi:hypothetical protein I302_104426 [Kwoniella bestiolae CBS 10118]|uniref:Guanyl nucleotide exchange factor Sql2 n=1 Tax=Kwoniella bestiolae CBS 10118 TaxID=1296100 RepID=A0AAJ8K7G0_9TREE
MIQHKSIPSSSSYHSTSEAGPSTQQVQSPPTPISPTNPTRLPTHVQAIHDFDPSLLASTSASNMNMYLSFKAGEIIRVHVRDATGWWDGEIRLRRGWFPSNYVREMGWDGSFHRRDESSATSNASVTSPTARHRDSSHAHSHSHSSHTRHASATSHHSRASTSTSVSQSTPSPATSHDPTNLDPAFQTLMHPIVQSLSLLESAIHSNRKPHIQPATACVISSIRAALMQTDCLSKESTTLVSWPVLARERKIVLMELSKLVGCAKTAGSLEGAEDQDNSKELEALAKAARGVFASVKRFLHLANEYGVTVTLVENPQEETVGSPAIAKDSASTASSHTSTGSTDDTAQSTIGKNRVSTPSNGNTRLQETFRLRAASIGDLRAARRRAASPPPPLPTASIVSSKSQTGRERSPSLMRTPMSATFSQGSGRSSPITSRSFHDRRVQGSMDSTFSQATAASSEDGHMPWEDTTPVPTPQATVVNRQLGSVADVHEAIGHAEDALLSIIAAFIGHIHSHNISSHPSSHAHLIEMTRETIDSVRELLTIVEAVGRNVGVRHKRPREIEALRIAKDQLYEVASKLVESAEIVANAPFSEFGEDSYDTEKARLLQSATGTLRSGKECVRLVKLCLPEDENVHLHATPRQGDIHGRQSTPRPSHTHEAPLVMREKPVGARGVHTLSGLHRKATSLSTLQKRYLQDGSIAQAPMEEAEEEDTEEEEDQEVVQDFSKDEDLTMRPGMQPTLGAPTRPSLQQHHTTPGLISTIRRPSDDLLRALNEANSSGPRSRSSSLTSPAPPRIKHRSPSRSADLDKFTADYDIPLEPQRRASKGTLSASSRLSTYTSASSQVSITSTAPTSIRSSDVSEFNTILPQTPPAHDVPTFGTLKVEIPTTTHDLSHATDKLALEDEPPIKNQLHLRPAAPVRSATAPAPSANADVRFWVVAHDYDPREIAFNSDGAIVGASLAVLVEKMTPHDGPVDPTFNATFFYTFRLFTTPTQLLEAIMIRYDLQPPAAMVFGEKERAMWIERKVVPVRLRIYNFLKSWLDQHWREETDDVILDTLQVFAKDVVSVTLPAMGPRLVDAVRRKLAGPMSAVSDRSSLNRPVSMDRMRSTSQSGLLHPPTISGGLPPTPVISKNLHSFLQKASAAGGNVNITEFDTLELARQFTIMESKMFCAVVPEDLLQTGKKTIPELKALSTLSNQITGWVADSILNETDAKKRASLVKFFIKLADKCLMMNNFSTMFAVLAGLNSSTIMRLKKTWDALPTKYKVTIERLRGVIEHTKNHAAYRARLREASTPCLPFLGLILTDITFTSDGNPSTRPSVLEPEIMLINQDKYNKLGRIAMDFKRYQEPFNFHELEAVQTFLRRVLTERGSGSVDALYRKSLMLEPRQGSEKLSSNVERPNWLSGKV